MSVDTRRQAKANVLDDLTMILKASKRRATSPWTATAAIGKAEVKLIRAAIKTVKAVK